MLEGEVIEAYETAEGPGAATIPSCFTITGTGARSRHDPDESIAAGLDLVDEFETIRSASHAPAHGYGESCKTGLVDQP